MREVVFKGKRIDNGEWEEGFVFDDGLIDSEKMFIGSIVIENNEIMGRCFCEVDPDTVGQYTGLKDKNGKRIFEGDILSIPFEEDRSPYEENSIYYERGEVYFDTERYGWYVRFRKYNDEISLWEYDNTDIEVIGNIHDNGELLEVR